MVCGASLNQSSRQRRRLFAEAGPSSPFQRILGPPHQLVQHRMDLISSSILGPPCERVFNAALEEYTLVSDAEEEIKSLAFTVSVIKGLLQDAERKQVEDAAIRNWLKGLKQVLFDAEDVLDEIATDEALRRRDTNGTRSVTRRAAKVRKIISSLFSVGAASASHAAAHRIKDIKKKFDTISRLKDRLGLRVLNENSCSAIGRKLETSSLLPNEANIIGRDDEKQNLQKLLLEPMKATEAKSSESNVHVIAVVGMGGVGKTTLVKHAYNNPAVGEHFQPRMWVCVSNDFDVKRITGEIMDAASISNITRGTSILLKGLSSHDLWSIFQRYAFDDHDLDKHPQLILVGRQIVGKLEGLPLAAKTIGRLLYSNPDHTYYKEAYVMHDLIHNLAELVSEGDCLRLEDNQQKRIMSKTVRHVSIASNRFDPIKIEELCKYENMRTLLFLRRRRFQLGSHLHNLFMKLQRLRVLGLRRCNIKELPASIGTLKHLRFLDLSHNLIGALPESSCNLHNLQYCGGVFLFGPEPNGPLLKKKGKSLAGGKCTEEERRYASLVVPERGAPVGAFDGALGAEASVEVLGS
ncbi:hypothetical protein Taro_048343 [Colocasia esculenta]|uniref:Uncharacterized protein n=1 Tax=Colocasia esculenta TaxID=4460 RepID=A0A843X864_COLES|nr:hypothetical protein [Colocasia esculenta]